MLFVLTANIIIGNFQFDYVHNVEIEQSWEMMTGTCKISLPRNLKLKDKSIKDLIKSGDSIVVNVGYNHEMNEEFVGYVSNVKPSIPFEITCEDEMWKLKQKSCKPKNWKTVKVSEVLAYIAPGYKYDVFDADLVQFRINNESAAQVLKNIQEITGFVSYFRGKTLVVGKPFSSINVNAKFHFQKNIISSDLEFMAQDDFKLKIRAISMSPANKKTEVTVGDEDGEERTLHFYNISKAELTARAKEHLALFKYDGYRGTLTSFGQPYVQHSYGAVLIDESYPERAGTYLVDKVKTTFGMSGFRREIKLGRIL
jgi:hypothetical protein